MTWENIGSVNTGDMPDEEDWIIFCLNLAKTYVEFVCGQAPAGSELKIMWHDHDLGSYPSLGVWYEFSHPGNYVGDCEWAMDAFNDNREYQIRNIFRIFFSEFTNNPINLIVELL